MMNPRVSVVIPTFNRSELLKETLESVADQTYVDIEIIVVDDGSDSAAAEEICREFSKCRYVRQNKSGRSAARNRGIAESTGEFVAFLDDDDLWKPNKLKRQIAFLDEQSHFGVVHCPAEVIDASGALTGKIIGDNDPQKRQGRVFRYALQRCIVKSPTALIRRDIIETCGLFDIELNGAEDFDFWARVAYHYEFGYIPEPLAYYRAHEGRHTISRDYLDACPYIAGKLCDLVTGPERNLVRRGLVVAYIREINLHTNAFSADRVRHSLNAVRLWPGCVTSRAFIGLYLIRPIKENC